MSTLLIQSCSATKQKAENPVQALDLYDGYFFKIIKKASRLGQLQSELDILIISAKHGVVKPDDEIKYYDQRMHTERAQEMNSEIVESIAESVEEEGYEKIWINLGKDYKPAIDGLESAVDAPIEYIEGCGIGMKGKQLKHLVSSERSIPAHGD